MKYYFTFGFGQPHEGYYHVIEAEDHLEARKQMNLRFDGKWAFQYKSAEAAGVTQFNLKELK